MDHFHLPSFSNSGLTHGHGHGHSGPSAPSPQSASPSHLASPSAPPTSRENSDAGASGSVVKKRKRLAPRDGSGPGSSHVDAMGIRSTQRVPLSCKECSRRKIKCDKMVPCRPCIDRGEEGQCRREAVMVKGRVVVNDVPPRDGSVTLESLAIENADIRRRLARLERSLARSPSLSPHGGEEALEFKEDRLAGVMEEVALGIGENVRWKGMSLLTDPETNAAGKDQWYHSVPLEACLSTIPNRVKCDALVRFYAEDLSWIIAAIHVPTFLHQHEAFWATSDRAQVKDDNWLAVFFAVLSFSGYFMEDPQAQLNGFQAGEVDRLAKIWFDCSIAILFRNNFAARPTFAGCQAILTLMYPFHLSGNTGLHVGMSSVLKSHARAMNLHLLGSSPGASKEDRLAREMGRRLWWNIVADDWTFLPYNRYSMFAPQQFNTALPDLTDEGHSVGSSFNSLSYRLAYYRSSRVLYRLFGNLGVSEDPRYESVLVASDELDQIVSRLPPELRSAAESESTSTSGMAACTRRLLGMTLAHRSYLIHRAYFVKSFRDRTYSKSHTACVKAASDIIMFAEKGLPATFYRLWNTTVWLVAAGIVLSLDLLQGADSKRVVNDAESRRATLSNLVELLYNSGDTTGISSRGAALITHLSRAEEEIISGSRTGVKFTRDDIVELIRQSETNRWQPAPKTEPYATSSNAGSVLSLTSGSPLATMGSGIGSMSMSTINGNGNGNGRFVSATPGGSAAAIPGEPDINLAFPTHNPEPTPWVNPDASADLFMLPDNNILSFLDELFPQAT